MSFIAANTTVHDLDGLTTICSVLTSEMDFTIQTILRHFSTTILKKLLALRTPHARTALVLSYCAPQFPTLPLSKLSVVRHHTIMTLNSPIVSPACEHRDSSGKLVLAEMRHLQCRSKFRCYVPLEEYRTSCPQILIVCHGEHPHPVPLPSKTPPFHPRGNF
jgi:hypothetical protein